MYLSYTVYFYCQLDSRHESVVEESDVCEILTIGELIAN
jgi:hypothetical protein